MKYKIMIVALAVMFLAGVAGCFLVWNAPPKRMVRIKQGDEVLVLLDLSREPDRVFTVSAGGGSNVIEIRDGKIRVQSADCPDQTCVRMGWLESAAMPVVCLPHRLVIEFADEGEEVDAVAK